MLDTSQILEFLNQEIEDARIESQRSGWSLWALVAAAGSVVWLAIDRLEPQPHFISVVAVFLSLTFASGAIRHLINVLSTDPTEPQRVKFALATRFAQHRPRLVATALRNIAVLAVILLSWKSVEWLGQYAALVAFMFSVITLVFGILVSYSNLPVPISTPRTVERAYFVSTIPVIIVNTIAAVAYTRLSITAPATVNEIQLGTAAFALFVIIPWLAGAAEQNPLIADLRQLRRDIIFRRIDDSEAVQAAEIILIGLRAEDVIQQHISRALAKHADIRQLVKELEALVEQTSRSMKFLLLQEKGTGDGKKVHEADELLRCAQKKRDQLVREIESNNKLLNQLGARCRMIVLVDPQADAELTTSLERALLLPQAELRPKIDLVGHRLQQLVSERESMRAPSVVEV